ncbi:hypothetical protein DFA_07862 [Cavenderia fasciculata]|uniref:Serine protease n=1 Tax=Cavenderia fasciculata TaxID=261658 RepID=F4Q3R6_CACFS|nr:uncharacterized protein DFA_07862 [Cavenderia fasciculata]EGG16882.1 hypothetical protein DFA_07862 [Cavenderia fasciculata]|eukprot:XP_004355356.1 hypothetical protein DFA_07862 [Cavenderia fasciculata]
MEKETLKIKEPKYHVFTPDLDLSKSALEACELIFRRGDKLENPMEGSIHSINNRGKLNYWPSDENDSTIEENLKTVGRLFCLSVYIQKSNHLHTFKCNYDKYQTADLKNSVWYVGSGFRASDLHMHLLGFQFPNQVPILLPSFPLNEKKKGTVTGYPADISKKDFEEKYPENNGMFQTVKDMAGQFEHKVVALTPEVTLESNYLSTHRCPTLHGVSGGPVITQDSKLHYFDAIHVGGHHNYYHNFAVSVACPAFVYVYFESIADDAFIKKHGLEGYKNYYLKLKGNDLNGYICKDLHFKECKKVGGICLKGKDILNVEEEHKSSNQQLNKESEEEGVCIIIDENGKSVIDGHVTILKKNGEPLDFKYDQDFKRSVQTVCKSVGRIFVEYTPEPFPESDKKPQIKQSQWECGTGFYVGNNCIMTAKHVIVENKIIRIKVEENGKENLSGYGLNYQFKIGRIYMHFGLNGVEGEDFRLADVEIGIFQDKDFELELLDRKVDDYFKKVYPRWSEINDFGVLKIKSKPETPFRIQDLEILVPSYPLTNLQHQYLFVIGYPGKIDLAGFKKSCLDNIQGIDVQSVFDEFDRKCKGFEKKTVSVSSRIEQNTSSNLGVHKCPTIGGTSGGFVGTDKTGTKFVSVHVGSPSQQKVNFAIPVDYPPFVYNYFHHVATNQEFIKQHGLEEYQKYYQEIKSEHPKVINNLFLPIMGKDLYFMGNPEQNREIELANKVYGKYGESIYSINNYNQLNFCPLPQAYQSNIELSTNSIGRLFIKYVDFKPY